MTTRNFLKSTAPVLRCRLMGRARKGVGVLQKRETEGKGKEGHRKTGRKEGGRGKGGRQGGRQGGIERGMVRHGEK